MSNYLYGPLLDFMGRHFTKVLHNNMALAPTLIIADFDIWITTPNQIIDYSVYGFTTLLGAPIITLIQPSTDISRAGFSVLHSFDTLQCAVSIAESAPQTIVGETLEFTTGVFVKVFIMGF